MVSAMEGTEEGEGAGEVARAVEVLTAREVGALTMGVG